MNNMDEITYWIYTKRAPCLMNYDNLAKSQSEVAECSKDDTSRGHNITKEVPVTKTKKRKSSIFDADSLSTDEPQVFHMSKVKKRPVLSSQSDSVSDLDFNIKSSAVKQKTKNSKLLRSRTLHKKSKLITSTPKAMTKTLRRSVRQAQLNNSQLNNSLEIPHSNGNYHNNVENVVTSNNYCTDERSKLDKVVNEQLKNKINGQIEDLSDVSGLTANYIRSTKAQSNKNTSKLHCKRSRKLLKVSKNSQKDSAMIVCTNKGVNTGLINAPLNCSTDSDQHVINLVSPSNGKPTKVNRGTSILKFMDTRSKKSLPKGNVKLNISFQSSSPSRYPKRYRAAKNINVNSNTTNITSEFNNSDRKENTDNILTRTRSGRGIGLSICQPGNSVLVLSNSMEQVSSMVSMNVATPGKKRKLTKQLRTRQNKKQDSKERSGYTACFSDSDDSEPLQRKFFCA